MGAGTAGDVHTTRRLLWARDEYLLRGGNFDAAQLGTDADALELALFFLAALGGECKEMLIFKNGIQLREEGREGDGRLCALKERLAAGGIGNLRKIALPLTDAEKTVTGVADTVGEKRVDHDAGFLRLLDGGGHVGAEGIAAEAVDSIANQQDFTARAGDGPARNQIHE